MEESTFLAVMRVWAALAWADGVIAHAEAKALRRVIDSADVSDVERRTALAFLDEKVDFELAGLTALDEVERETLYRSAVRLAVIDEHFADEEGVFLVRLREGLRLAPEVARTIEAAVLAAS